jgi:hypothetical protein
MAVSYMWKWPPYNQDALSSDKRWLKATPMGMPGLYSVQSHGLDDLNLDTLEISYKAIQEHVVKVTEYLINRNIMREGSKPQGPFTVGTKSKVCSW